MSHFTPEERAYMDHLDEIYPDLPYGGFGLLVKKGDPIAFEIGIGEWCANLSPDDREALGLTA